MGGYVMVIYPPFADVKALLDIVRGRMKINLIVKNIFMCNTL
jgi:hypothetical protein